MSQFDEMGLDESLLQAIKELGFTEPTPVQEQVIPKILLNPTDLIAQAQTGTGKTAAYGLPLIQSASLAKSTIQGLVLCPTRELCIQITSDLTKFARFREDFRVVPVYGGASIETQIRSLQRGAQIVVGTPGRVLDLISRGSLKVKKIDWLVLDEADEMLNMGFKDDLDAILASTPKSKRTLLFSATMPDEIRRIASEYMRDPIQVTIGEKNAGTEQVSHVYYVAHAKDRYEVLKRIADIHPSIYGIVFCRTRQETKEVAEKFIKDGYNADALHGDLAQQQRDHVMNRFRSGYLQMLVATDVAARGLDVNDLTHVINYNLPDDLEVYIHRSGRTGRAGKSGVSISIVHMKELHKIKELERMTKRPFNRMMIPGGKEICKKQLFNLVDKVEKVELKDAQIEEFLPEINKKLEWLSREDLIKHFFSVEFNRFLTYYKNAADLNVATGTTHEKAKITRPKRTVFTRFYVNLGSKHGINASKLLALVNDQTQNRSIQVGRIEILKSFSFIECDRVYETEILKALQGNVEVSGVKVMAEISKPDSPQTRMREKSREPKRPAMSKGKKKTNRKSRFA